MQTLHVFVEACESLLGEFLLLFEAASVVGTEFSQIVVVVDAAVVDVVVVIVIAVEAAVVDE